MAQEQKYLCHVTFQLPVKKKFIANVAVYLAHLNALYTHLNTITTKNGNKHIVLSLDLLHVWVSGME